MSTFIFNDFMCLKSGYPSRRGRAITPLRAIKFLLKEIIQRAFINLDKTRLRQAGIVNYRHYELIPLIRYYIINKTQTHSL